MSPSIMICPATCELCGQWMPGHSEDCPRSGVHPSQWSPDSGAIFLQENNDTIDNEEFIISGYHYWSTTRGNMMTIKAQD